LGVVIKGRQ
jgi:hypothetical protein